MPGIKNTTANFMRKANLGIPKVGKICKLAISLTSIFKTKLKIFPTINTPAYFSNFKIIFYDQD
jgi:hypothetical protein